MNFFHLLWNINRIRHNNLTYLSRFALLELSLGVQEAEKKLLTGTLIEAGSALGGSAIAMASAKETRRPLILYDVFEQIPPPSNEDGDDVHKKYSIIQNGDAKGIGNDTYYGYLGKLEKRVTKNFEDFGFNLKKNNITLIKGLYEDTLWLNESVALAHIDCDWYSSVKICLERITPKLVIGGRLIIDDYYYWSGCRRAVDEFFSGKSSEYQFIHKTRLHIIRRRKD